MNFEGWETYGTFEAFARRVVRTGHDYWDLDHYNSLHIACPKRDWTTS
jgi:hypothetical protein